MKCQTEKRMIESNIENVSMMHDDKDSNEVTSHSDDTTVMQIDTENINHQSSAMNVTEEPIKQTRRVSAEGKLSHAKIDNLEDEIINIKSFIKSKPKMTGKATTECKMKLLILKDKMKHKLTSKSEKVLYGILEKLYDTSKKASNSTFRKVMLSEIQIFEEKCQEEKTKINKLMTNENA